MEKTGADFVFITNTRSKKLDGERVYKVSFPLFNYQDFIPPDIFNWKEIYCVANGKLVKGNMIVIGSTAEDVLARPKKAKQQISKAIRYAVEELKVKAIGFGAGTKRLPNKSDLEKYKDSLIFTHGDSLTAAVCLEEIKLILEKLNIYQESEAKIIIVGAYGKLGTFLSEYLAKHYKAEIYLVGQSLKKLDALVEILPRRCGIVELSNMPSTTDLIITVTNHPKSVLNKEHLDALKFHAIVFDPAQPPNFDLETYETCKKNVLRVDGAIVNNSGLAYIDNNGEMPLGPQEAFACLAETILISQMDQEEIELIKKFNLMGSIDFEASDYLFEKAKSYGWRLNDLKNFGKNIASSDMIRFFC